MKVIKTLTDKDFNLDVKEMINPRKREGARGLVFNKDGNIAILFKKNKNEYKLIGGGIDDGEEPEDAFVREVKEETGCSVKIDKYLGNFIEEKSQDSFIQTSYVFVAHIIGNKSVPKYTKKEEDEGSRCIWLDIDEAMYLIKNCEDKLKPSKYDGEMSIYHTKFIVKRDYEILKYYKSIVKSNLNES